jgi:hypothetical protein
MRGGFFGGFKAVFLFSDLFDCCQGGLIFHGYGVF